MENIVIKIHEDNLATFNQKLADLNTKFSKKNLPLINCSMTSETMKGHRGINELDTYEYTLYIATLSSDFNQTNLSGVDCTFEGVVSLIEKSENDKIYTFKNINYSNLLADCMCDKCHKKIGRNKYLVFSKTEEVKSREDLVVLGTSCAKDYFPFNVESYFGYLESAFEELGNYDEYCGSFGGCASHYHSLRSIHNAMCAVSENYKIYKKEGVTKSDVLGWINNDKINKYDRYRDVYPMPQNPIAFEDVISWVDEMYNKDDLFGDFNYNARSVFYKTLDDGTRELRHEIHDKYVGIAVYGLFSAKQNHDKEVAKKLAEEKRMAENAEITYFGNIGDKFEKELTFERMFSYETHFSYYGETQFILIFADDEGHKFKWTTSNGNYKIVFDKNAYDGTKWFEYEVGHKYLIKGAVKAHEEYKGCKQTVITRCKVVNDFIDRNVEIKTNKKGDTFVSVTDVDPFENTLGCLIA